MGNAARNEKYGLVSIIDCVEQPPSQLRAGDAAHLVAQQSHDIESGIGRGRNSEAQRAFALPNFLRYLRGQSTPGGAFGADESAKAAAKAAKGEKRE
jgi:hypothetical protein